MDEFKDGFKNDHQYFKLQDSKNLLEIKSFQAELEKCRMENIKSIMKTVNDVRHDFETLKSEIGELTENHQTDYLRKRLYDIEECICDLKEEIKEKLFKLINDSCSLSKDLQFMTKRTEDWGKPLDNQILKPVKPSIYKVRKNIKQDPASEFQKFLAATGGHTGGWEEQDHLLFLRERLKYKGGKKFISTLHYLLPDLSLEMIEEHETWYQKYQDLKNEQKEAIKKWKTQRRAQQEKKKDKEEVIEVKKEVKKSVRNQIDIAERIKEWKNQQLLKKLEEEENMKREKEKLKEEEKRKKELQEMKKLAVMQYKAEKLTKNTEILPTENEAEIKEAKAKNKVLLKSFRLQDMKFIEKKKTIRLQVESKSTDKLERLRLAKPALEFILQRDPKRVFQPTLIWSQHCLEAQKREKLSPVFDLNSIPRLAIPEWRRELKFQ